MDIKTEHSGRLESFSDDEKEQPTSSASTEFRGWLPKAALRFFFSRWTSISWTVLFQFIYSGVNSMQKTRQPTMVCIFGHTPLRWVYVCRGFLVRCVLDYAQPCSASALAWHGLASYSHFCFS